MVAGKEKVVCEREQSNLRVLMGPLDAVELHVVLRIHVRILQRDRTSKTQHITKRRCFVRQLDSDKKKRVLLFFSVRARETKETDL